MKPIVKVVIVLGGLGAVGLLDFYFPEIKSYLKKRSKDEKKRLAKEFLNGEHDLKYVMNRGVTYPIIQEVQRTDKNKVAEAKFRKIISEALKKQGSL